MTPNIRVLRCIEIGAHPRVDELFVNRTPNSLFDLQEAAIQLDRCGEVRNPTETEKFYVVCSARVAPHKHWQSYLGEVVSLPRGESVEL